VAAIEPSYLTVPLPEDAAGIIKAGAAAIITERSTGVDVLGVGPGLGRSRGVEAVVTELYKKAPQPVVIDADALNALAGSGAKLGKHGGPRVLTPHPGEFSRLTGHAMDAIRDRREELAFEFAAEHQVVLVLKGAGTVVTDGDQLYVNDTGNSGMGTGGTGDVLTGLLTALLAQGLSPFDAACLSVWVHGRAGDLAAGHFSEPGLIASDLPRYIGRVWLELQSRQAD